MLADPGSYEERYKLTGAALGLVSALVALGLGFLWHTQLIFAALTVLLAIPAVLALARPPVAFRADHAGITLGSGRQLPHRPAVFIPWADVEKIILYPGRKAAGFGDYIWASAEVECTGVLRREGAPALPHGNEQAPGCPVPGVAAGATRRIKNWRLDRERLAAVTAAAAPGIPVIDARNDPARRIEGAGHLQDRPPHGL
jgi:hypothetical protein